MSLRRKLAKWFENTSVYLDAYYHIIASKILSYKSDLHNHTLKPNEMVIGYNSVATLTSVRRYFRIIEFPQYVDEALFQFLRNQLVTQADTSVAVQDEELPKIHVNFRVNMKPHHIDFSSKIMKQRKVLWDQAINESESEINADGTHFRSQAQNQILERNKWLAKSWTVFQQANENHMATPTAEIIIELAVLKNDMYSMNIMESNVRKLVEYCSTRGIVLEEIKGGLWNSLWEFMKMYPPVASEDLLTLPPDVPRMPVPTDFVSSLMGVEQGKIRGVEIFLGLDMLTAKFVYKDAAITGQAENILITGVTGSGKSNLCKSIVLNFSFNGYTTVILDRDGEYLHIENSLDGAVIDFESGKYFDTFEIAEPTGDAETDATLYTEAMAATESMFNIWCATPNYPEMTPNEKSMFSDIVYKMGQAIGLDALDSSTWHLSKSDKYSYKEFYKILNDSLNDAAFVEAYTIKEIRDFIHKLKPYLDPTGSERSRFQEPISVNEIYKLIDNGCPIVDFNLRIPEEVTPSKNTIMKMITASHLTSVVLAHNKKQKKFTLCVVEEMNRYLQNPQALVVAASMATGNRKKNAISIFLTNTPSTFIEGDESLQQIKQNMNYVMFGRFTDGLDNLRRVAAEFDLLNSWEMLKTVCTNDAYRYQFFIRDTRTNETTIIKCFYPEEYEYIFHTRDKKEQEDTA